MNPTPEALALAVKLSGHCGYCEEQLREGKSPCDDCLADAASIDSELQLPQRNAALAAAQALSDWNQEGIPDDLEIGVDLFCQLRDALAAIQKTK